MSNFRPTNGHPSRESAIMALLDEGLTAPEIGAALGLSTSYVRSVFSVAGYRAGLGSVTIGEENRDRLEAAARARGIKPRALAGRILAAVLADDLVSAVLDDRPLTDQMTPPKTSEAA